MFILMGASSLVIDLANASTAPPVDDIATKPGLDFLAGEPLTKTILPFLLKFFVPCLTTFEYPHNLSNEFLKPCISIFKKGPIALSPPVAVLIKTSYLPIFLNNAFTSFSTKTSAFSLIIFLLTSLILFGFLLTAKILLAPSFNNNLIVANPIPDVPPNTTIFFPFIFIFFPYHL